MYWPIGAAKAYALSKRATLKAKTVHSQDGVPEDGDPESAEASSSSSFSNTTSGSGDTAVSQDTVPNSNGVNGIPTEEGTDHEILAIRVSRHGHIFVTITSSSVTAWQAKPTAALAAVTRSPQSLKAYGANCALMLRPDALIVVVQTVLGYLITYTLETESQAQVYRTVLPESHRHVRRGSVDAYSYRRPSTAVLDAGPGESDGIREVNLRFRMVIRIDAGISKALALDDELVVATQRPAALQSIRWVAEEGSPQTSTDLLSRMPWYTSKSAVVEMVHDRPMNLTCWLADDGKAYAVQRRVSRNAETGISRNVWQGFCFREPESDRDAAVKVAINARFSLIAVGCADGRIDVYVVKDYSGNVPLSHRHQLQATSASSGALTHLIYSPDGYCLFAGYQRGWATWSVYSKAGANSFGTERSLSEANDECWLQGIKDAFWLGGGCELALLANHDDRIWILDMARSAATGCLSSANIARGLLHSSTSITLYQGHCIADLTALPAEAPLWQTVQIPNSYLVNQWPIKTAVISSNSKYVAVAGKRGLAHYSVASGRWRTFEDLAVEQDFAVRGGMCWYQHYLITAIETGNRHFIRIHTREKALERTMYEEELSAPAILITTSGTDSLLVYTHDNTLLHYIIMPSGSSSVKLVQVGQIGFHGIIRAPPRVRAISWILPEEQLEAGDPAQDVATASVLFLVDGKLVLLQPGMNEEGDLKYDMRVIAQNVETYMLLRDQPTDTLPALRASKPASNGTSPPILNGSLGEETLGHSLRESLWYFSGDAYHIWPDISDLLSHAPAELGRDLPPTVSIPIDFYPVAPLISKGIIHGLESELLQRRDINFSFSRAVPRTTLFLPQLLRHHLAEYNSPAALHLANSYSHLAYFPHALEVLLHDVLDAEVDSPPFPPETALLPTVIAFLSSFPEYLDVVVNCTRKTELRSWRTLFTHLPPVRELFERSLEQSRLKTAAGYLLVLHAMAEEGVAAQLAQKEEVVEVDMFARLLARAGGEGDWELCGELARFLVGIDGGGGTLREVLEVSGLGARGNGTVRGSGEVGVNGETPVGNGGSASSGRSV